MNINLAETVLIKELIIAFKALKNNPILILAVVGLDLLFAIVYTFLYSLIGNQIAAHAVLIANQVSPMLAKGETGLLAKLFEGTLQPLTMKLLLLMLLLFVLLYIVYVIIQGPAWYLASKIADQQSSLGKYLATFAKLNLLWLLFFVIIKMLDITLGLRYQLIKKFSPLALNVSAPIVTVLFVILGIIVFTSYGRLRALEFLKIPFLRMIGMLFVCVVLFLVLWFIIDLFASAPFEARVLVQIIFLPIFVLVRTYSIRVVNSS